MQPGGGYEFLASESTVGVKSNVATGTDTGVDTGMSMEMNQELSGMIEGVNPDELTLEDESFIEELKVLVDKVGKDKVDSKILDFLNQSQMKLDELKKVQTPSNLAVGEVKTLTYFEEDVVEIPSGVQQGDVTAYINEYLIDKYGKSDAGNIRFMAYTDASKKDGVYVELTDSAIWSNPDYFFDLRDDKVYGNIYEFKITREKDLSLPEGYQIDLETYEPTVSVTVPIKTVTVDEVVEPITALKNTDFDLLGLPGEIRAISDKGSVMVDVTWNEKDYFSALAKTYTIHGSSATPAFVFKDGDITATVTLVDSVTVDSYEETTLDMKLGEGISLPETINVYQGENKVVVPVEDWRIAEEENSDEVTKDYLKNLAEGEYVFYANLPKGCKVSSVLPQLKLVVKRESVTLDNPFENDIEIDISEIDSFELPSTLKGKTDSGRIVEFDVENWKVDREITQNGVYVFEAVLGKTDYVIEDIIEVRVFVYDSTLPEFNNIPETSKYDATTVFGNTSEKIDIEEVVDSKEYEEYVITINQDAGDALTIDFVNVNPGTEKTPQPTDYVHQKIKIINNSGITYNLDKDSFKISTVKEDVYADKLSSIYGFDGQLIPSEFIRNRFENYALLALLDKPSTPGTLTEEDLTDENINKYLKAKGYQGFGALNQYYLDFYNDRDKTEASCLEDLSVSAQREILGGADERFNGYSKETNPEIIELYYNTYYNQCIGINFKNVPTDKELKGSDTSMMIGAYMRGSTYINDLEYANVIDYLAAQIDGLAPGESTEIDLYYFVHGPNTHNAFQNTSYKARIAFELEEAPEEPTPTPDPDPTPDPRPEPEEPEEEIEDDDTPETGGEEEIEEDPTPETGGSEEEIEDEETPEVGNKDDVTDTGVASTMPWLFGLITSMGVAIAELFRRRQK